MINEKGSSTIDRLISFVLGSMVAIIAIFLLASAGITPKFTKLSNLFSGNSTQNETLKNAWKLPPSQKKGFPDTDESGNLYIYNIDTKLRASTNINVLSGSGEMDMGETTPNPSPDLLYTAVIDKNSNELKIISNDTLETVTVPNTKEIRYIVGWSPAGKSLVYYIEPKTVASVKEGMMPEWDSVEKFEKERAVGFFSLNVSNGEITKITPISNVVAVLSDDEILTRVRENRLVIFDTKNFIADYETVKEEFPFGTGQYNISQDSTMWSFISSKNPTKDMYIGFTAFPAKTGTVVDSGAWADVQWPKISPNGQMVAYQKFEGKLDTGYPNPYLWVYRKSDTGEFKSERIGAGKPLAWVDNSNIVVEITQKIDEKIVTYKGVLNIDTKESTVFKVSEGN